MKKALHTGTPELNVIIPHLPELSAGFSTLTVIVRLPGIVGPVPSAALDKVLQNLCFITL